MTELFQSYLITSCLGAVLAFVLLVAKPLTKKIFSAAWHYYIWLAVLAVMVLPVQFHLPILGEENVLTVTYDWADAKVNSIVMLSYEPTPETESGMDENGRYIVSPMLQEKRVQEVSQERLPERIAHVWWAVAVALLLARLLNYGVFLVKVFWTTTSVSCPEVAGYTKRKVFVRRADWAASPLLLGVFFPVLILPRWQLSTRELHNVLAHEMTHLRRNDMLFKWFVVLVKSLHWFNPFVYVISAQVNLSCEISCDISVTESMDKAQQMSYVDTILKLVSGHKTREYALTMGMSGNKNQLKKRFQSMKCRPRVGVIKRAVSCGIAVVLLTVAFVCSGELAMNVSAEKETSESFFVSECEECDELTLYLQRDMVTSVLGCSKFPYLVYTYRCEHCKYVWNEREAVVDGMALKYQSGNKNPMLVEVESFPTVIDMEAEYALTKAGIDLNTDADSAEEALELIEKAVKKAR